MSIIKIKKTSFCLNEGNFKTNSGLVIFALADPAVPCYPAHFMLSTESL